MEMVGLGGLGRQFPGQISGGQQQRVALARALVPDSTVVLFDEPLSNVDARVREQLRFEMKRMQRQLRFSGLYVTHDQSEAMELGDRIAVLEFGRVAALGAPQEIYDRPNSKYVATFLGSANIWSGVIADVNGSEAQIRTSFGATLNASCTPGSSLASVTAIEIVVRPEKVRISASPPPGLRNVIQATVTARTFAGALIEFRAACGNKTIRITAVQDEQSGKIGEGDTVYLTIEPEWIRLLPPHP
jgi:ABC-type Fe3+/spermidine/putrescine transport system ATPase subunit